MEKGFADQAKLTAIQIDNGSGVVELTDESVKKAIEGAKISGTGNDLVLDLNSLYSNLLQCTHFASTCALAVDAERGEGLLGWLSAYRPPSDPGTLFVWQVAVAPSARRSGVAHDLLEDILARDACRGVVRVCASVTATNVASLGFFESFARRRGTHVELSLWLDESEAFRSRHESEWLVRIDDLQGQHRPAARFGRTGD